MTKYVLLMALFFALVTSSSCGSSNGCRGGGWYGDRNLTQIQPHTPDEYEPNKTSIECKP